MSLLDDARKRINEIDAQMAELYEHRMQAVEDVIRYKVKNKMEVLDSGREHSVLDRNMALIKEEKYKESYRRLMEEILVLSKDYQKSVINSDLIGYQGVEGAFSHIASQHVFPYYPKKKYATFEDVCKAVEANEIAYGVIPFENSFTGEVGEVLDLIMRYHVYIQQIYDLKISQNLLGIKGATLQDIKQVYSKDQAIYQSKQFLEGRGYDLIPYPNTALAAEYVAGQQDKTKAAIAAKENAELYGLEILAADINTSEQNTTRFIVIGKHLVKQGNRFSMIFTTKHEAGALVQAMEIIAKLGFNMESIKSRSMKDKPWEYYFYVEIDGSLEDAHAAELVEQLKEACDEVKLLGAYTKESRDEA